MDEQDITVEEAKERCASSRMLRCCAECASPGSETGCYVDGSHNDEYVLRARLAECEATVKRLQTWGSDEGPGRWWGELEAYLRLDAEFCDGPGDIVGAVKLRFAECEQERDEAQQAADNSYELYREAWDKNAALLAENRILLSILDVATSPEMDLADLLPETMAEVERVRALEQAHRELRSQLELLRDATAGLLSDAVSAALTPEVKK